jgi:ABC-type sugar transport system ATPase subunit
MLFDEPTAALSQSERDNFLRVIRQLAARGVAIVLVSHNLGEVLSVSDTITVLRGGRVIESAPGASWTRDRLVHAMTGDVVPVSVREEHPTLGEDLLTLRGLEVPGVLTDVDLHVRRGEIVGLAGLVGAGRTTILRSLAGAEPRSRAELRIEGKSVGWPRSVRDAIVRVGIGLVPEERKLEGLHLALSAPDNVTITDLGRYGRGGLVERRKQFAVAERLLTQMKLSRPVGDYPVGDLSGGNQQKVAIAKWLARSPRVLLFDEPTRGIDVVAKVDVMSAIRAYARAGHAVIVTSSELEEVLDISDRLYVVSRGAIVGEFDMHTAPPTLNQVVQLSFARMG